MLYNIRLLRAAIRGIGTAPGGAADRSERVTWINKYSTVRDIVDEDGFKTLHRLAE